MLAFFGHFWYILWSFAIFFPVFGMLYREKLATLVITLTHGRRTFLTTMFLLQTLYHGSGHGLDQQQLVLDVEGTRVFLAPKEPGKRNQLWRMTSSGMIQVAEGQYYDQYVI
jgi:hypothetical protein